MSLEWMGRGACTEVEPELFHAFTPNAIEAAKAICNGSEDNGTPPCPVRATCLAYALATRQDYGVWGGLSEDERRALRVTPRPEKRPNDPTDDARCGTYAGVGRHRRRHEALCRECRTAKSVADSAAKRRKRQEMRA